MAHPRTSLYKGTRGAPNATDSAASAQSSSCAVATTSSGACACAMSTPPSSTKSGKSAGDAAHNRANWGPRTRATGGRLCTTLAMIKLERSTFSIGLRFCSATVSVMVLSKQCVATTTTCKAACSMGRAPDFVRASKRSKAASFSRFCSSLSMLAVIGEASRACCERFDHVLPGVMIVGRKALSESNRPNSASISAGKLV
mmetsp:Transcript_65199/g.128210  ORF Transcript_65199/g.128210 Transcript_65199/m.128210 type:complete len:200 (-) Transcript_65199:253-852(-)